MNTTPKFQRMAVHQVGHAVVQALVGRDRFAVSRLALGVEANASWPGRPAWGAAAVDRETRLSIYEFGLVTLAGIAAEERYLAAQPPEHEPLVALSDLAEWQQQAREVLLDAGKIRLVSLNVMRRLHLWFAEPAIWQVVEGLSAELLANGTLDATALRSLLAKLPTPRPAPLAGHQRHQKKGNPDDTSR